MTDWWAADPVASSGRPQITVTGSREPDFASAISGIESGGRYDALGPQTKTGDRAFGKYQVMGANIGPWSEKILGRSLTPDEFLSSPEAQDAVFQGVFGEYAQKYGPEGAARAWFAGEGGMNNPNARDQLGTSVAAYANKFSKALGPQAALPPATMTDAGTGPVPAAQAPAGPQVAQAAPVAPAGRAAPAIDPQTGAYIKQLLANPATRQYGMQLYQQYAKPQATETDETKEYALYSQQERAAGRQPKPFFDYKTDLRRAGATNVSTNVGGGSDKQIFDAMDESAKGARATAVGLTSLREARNALEGGAITGFGANQVLDFQKLGSALGLTNSDKIVNTETFRAAIAPQVAAMLKSTVGTANISNTDREFAEKAAGGNITLDGKSITRLLNIMEKASVTQLEQHQKRLDKVYSDPEKYGRERALFGVDLPAVPQIPPPAPPPAPSSAAPAPPPAGHIQDGYRFKGGNPADPKNWEKQ
jgi:hypothetical protein